MAKKKTEKTEEIQTPQAEEKTLTKREKITETKNRINALIVEILQKGAVKKSDLIDKVLEPYKKRYPIEETDNNGFKGLIGLQARALEEANKISLDEEGVYTLKKQTKTTKKKADEKPVEEKKEPQKTATRGRKKKTEEPDKTEPVAALPVETPKADEKPVEEKKETQKTATRGRKKKTEEPVKVEPVKAEPVKVEPVKTEEPIKAQPPVEAPKAEEKPVETPKAEEKKTEEKPVEEKPTQALVEKEKAEVAKKDVVDMSFLFGGVKPKTPVKAEVKEEIQPPVETPKAEEKPAEKPAIKVEEKPAEKTEKPQEKKLERIPAPVKTGNTVQAKPAVKAEEKPQEKKTETPVKQEKTPQPQKQQPKPQTAKQAVSLKQPQKAAPTKERTADEKLQEAFIERLHQLGGEYFEYYSVYLLERYSRRNGRRLESLKISGGDRDGGIDGELVLTDRNRFRETIYIQAKNWNADGTNKNMKMVGETVLQQFIGACMWRQAQDGKQNCRGIFMTLTQFTAESKRLLAEMSEKIVGYDAKDIYEAAKECEFGIVKRGNEWVLDENLLSGERAFFFMF